ncbi:Cna B-type domain-containing protein [Peptostreptococcus porci]|uniref:Cna B-type domain-containing protein n=1 Tax=Peptostreptococcus porci TaxID=2652282 RepID=UPI0023F0B776|nr:Cna B-type domain-containing protein [Peptostreptococcus porci]MDD7183268.1 Cna B-type domain-containing protein [Peptostreptococcus porci]
MRKKLGAAILSILVLLSNLSSIFLGTSVVHAQNGIIKEVKVDKTEIRQGENFSVDVKFGGQGVRVSDGQTEEISFDLVNTKIQLPKEAIDLQDSNTNKSLGKVTFSDNKAIVRFNQFASTLNDVEGGFNFNVFGYWNKDLSQPGEGSIGVIYSGGRQEIKFINPESGITTDNIYSKKGVWLTETSSNSVDWVFTFNAAHKATGEKDVVFKVTDNLDNTMEWDSEANSVKASVLEYQGKWYSLEQAKNMSIKIDITGNYLSIEIPRHILVDGQWVRPLDGKEITIRLTSKVKEDVMKNKEIKYVTNKSNLNLTGIDWQIDPKETEDSVEIIRSGGWATGTKPGELKIVKKIQNTNIPIKGVEFVLEREDKNDIEVRERDGYINRGKSIVLTTNDDGVANIKGLRAAKYIVKESKAPDWIEFDVEQPIIKIFEISDQDTEGKEYTVENKKKTTNIQVEKVWKDSNNKIITAPQSIKVQLYKDGETVGQPVDLSTVNSKYAWENLDISDDTGKLYSYSVKELDSNGNAIEQGNSIKVGQKWFKVNYGGSLQAGFVITNEELKPWTPMEPPTRNISVTKEWKDDLGSNLEAPEDTIQVELYKDGNATGNKRTLSRDNNWTVTFEKLPVSATLGGENHKYTVKEVGENDSKITLDGKTYSVQYTKNSENSFTVKNTLIKPETINIIAQKTWSNGEETKEIDILLLENGKYNGKHQIANSQNNWQVAFNNLPKFDENKKEINYIVSETTASLDTVQNNSITLNGKKYDVQITEKSKYNFVIDNKYVPEVPPTPKKKDVEVSKVSFSDDNKTVVEVVGANIQIFEGENADGKKIDEWTTEKGKNHIIKDLEVGKKYTFREVSAPKGLKTVTDFIFSVDENGKVTVHSVLTSGKAEYKEGKLIVTDDRDVIPEEPKKKDVEVSKISFSDDNKTVVEVVGAVIQVFEGENTSGKKIDEWTTAKGKNHIIKDLEVGKKYTFREVSAPKGLKTVTDFIFSVDENGKVTVHSILTSGKAEYKDGKLIVTDDREIIPDKPKPQEPKRKDVEVSKVSFSDDNKTVVEVVGAVIQVFEGENVSGKKVDEWTTAKGKNHIIKDLEVGKKYTFREVTAPKGLKTVTDFIFSVDENGKVTVHSVLTSGKAEFKEGKLIVTDDREIVPDKPTPSIPNNPSDPTPKKPEVPNTNTNKTLPKTGDDSSITPYALLLGLSGISLILIEIKRRNDLKKEV